LISVLIDATERGDGEGRLDHSLASLRAQLYQEWEACVVGGPERHSSADARIRSVPAPVERGEAAALNVALGVAQGEFIAVLATGDRLAEHALYVIAVELAASPLSDVVYSDEDFCDDNGLRSWPYFKPDWDPDLALGQDLLGRIAAMRKSTVQALAGFRGEFDPASQYDLHLRVAHAVGADHVSHVPLVLYHRRIGASPPRDLASAEYAEAAREALWQQCRRADPAVVSIEPARVPFWNRVVRAIPEPEPLVSVIVPTRDHPDLLRECVEGVLKRTDYRSLELIVMDNDSVKQSTRSLFSELQRDARVRIVASPGPFNFSAIVNRGAASARGDILLLLNNDVEVLAPGWLTEMVSHVVRPEIGAVGARLLFPSGRVQHAGIVLFPSEPNSCHALRLARRGDPGYFGQLALTRSFQAVTGACLAVRRQVFLDIGGLDEENLPVAFNDVDLCLRIGARGYRILCTPFAELIHRESVSRGLDAGGAKKHRAQAERRHAVDKWPTAFGRDKYGNPNLAYVWNKGIVLSPPQVPPPWRAAQG